MQHHELIPHLFRTEYSKIVAVLCNTYGLKYIETAEDIASETFLKATEVWGLKGAPENPAAWLYTVAKNKVKDHFRHHAVVEKQMKEAILHEDTKTELDFEFTSEHITDSQLAMLFAVCNPGNPAESQICLALQILCGFSVEEIANAFLANIETIKKRLHRARVNLRQVHFQVKTLNETEINLRLDAVLKSIYLLFNEGYFSKSHNQSIRKELCSEAIRLAHLLTQSSITNTTQVNALLALLFFQSSRLDARADHNGEVILFDDQDKSLWNKELIEKGNYYLITACEGSEISKYHIEAAIAYWHTTPTDENKWQHILSLYNQLLLIEHSPVIALNRAFALAKVVGNEQAIPEVEKLNLRSNPYYYSLLGYLFAATQPDESIRHYGKAIALTKSDTEKQAFTKEVNRLLERK